MATRDVEAFLDGMHEIAAGRLGGDVRAGGGTPSYVTAEATLRGIATTRTGQAVSLSRPVDVDGPRIVPGSAELEIDVRQAGRVGVAKDRLHARCHSMDDTHIDGPNHLGLDGRWYPGVQDFDEAPGIDSWADRGIMTRALFVDVPAARGEAWVTEERPVEADELDAILQAAGVRPKPGDALLLCMGRDVWEASRGPTVRADHFSAVDVSVAQYVADCRFGALLWDFVDAPAGHADHMCVHFLNYAIGLATVDNCDFGALRIAMSAVDRIAVFLTLAPLMIVGATGSLVNPVVIL